MLSGVISVCLLSGDVRQGKARQRDLPLSGGCAALPASPGALLPHQFSKIPLGLFHFAFEELQMDFMEKVARSNEVEVKNLSAHNTLFQGSANSNVDVSSALSVLDDSTEVSGLG